MPKFVIERNIPGAGDLSEAEIVAIAKQSCSVLQELGPSIQWMYSYVTDDQIICTYIAPDEDLVRVHATKGGFPADRVQVIHRVIDPTTSELVAA